MRGGASARAVSPRDLATRSVEHPPDIVPVEASRRAAAANPLLEPGVPFVVPGVDAPDLGERYVVFDLLARGAMGTVCQAYDRLLRREVTVRVMRCANREAQERLLEEARSMAKLSHMYVLAVYDAATEFRRAIEFREDVLGSDDRWLPESRMHLGQALFRRGRVAEAHAELREALVSTRAVFGPEHPVTAAAATASALVLVELGEREEGRELLEQAWAVQEGASVLPEERAETAWALAKLLWDEATERPRARALIARAIRDYEAAGEPWRDHHRRASLWLRSLSAE